MRKMILLLLATLTFTTSSFAQLGSLSSDLVFTPITPCRIIDTRNAGGAISSATTRVFKGWAASYASQGGRATDCGLPQTTNIAALSVNLVVISPVGDGWIAAWPVATPMPLVSNLNYKANDVLANSAVLKINQTTADFNLYTTTTTHFVADVTGYYSKPVATALECKETTNAAEAIGIGEVATVTAPVCETGYTATSTNCQSHYQVWFSNFSNGICSAYNNGGTSRTVYASRTCCRIPGR